MSAKKKPILPGPARATTPPRRATQQAPQPQADGRWQRSVRYGWDKGGARGGRK